MGKKYLDGRRKGSGTWKRKPKPFHEDQPDICDQFERFLLEGWSPRRFQSLLLGGGGAYARLKNINKRFYELAEAYTPKMHRRGPNHYKHE